MRSHISKILNLKVYKHNTYSIAFSEDEQKDGKKKQNNERTRSEVSSCFKGFPAALFLFIYFFKQPVTALSTG